MFRQTQPAEASINLAPARRLITLLDPRAALARAYATNRALALLGVLMLIALAVALAGLAFDPRMIASAPAWLKPFKFAISIALYSFTLLWMLSFVQGRRWIVRTVSLVTLVAGMVEMVVIMTQVVRGTISHFNAASDFDSTLFSIMGTFVLLLWTMNLVAAALLLFQRMPDPAFAWALRLGLLLTLVGGATGVLMTRPTPAQQAALDADQHVTIIGAHSVGVADGGAGMPITGWSLTGGDLRIGHFVGLHALQMLPLIGWLLARRRAHRLGDRRRVALVLIAGLGYLGLIALLIWQALRGQPLLAPDVTTTLALLALISGTALPAIAIIAHGRR